MADKVILVQEEPRGPSQLVEVPVTSTGRNRVAFPDVPNLRSQATQNIVIKVIRLITLEVLTNGMIQPFVNAPLTELQKIALVIYCEGWEKALYLPILTLNDVATPGGTFPHRYHATRFSDWQNVDWSKTYLQYANGTSSDIGETDGYTVMFDIEYVKIDGSGVTIIGPS